jgi:transcriptional regulator GlxA family with amidase domain
MRFGAQELASGPARSPALLAKLAELLFVEAVRRYLAALPPDETGWRAAIADPMIGRALAQLHQRLDRRWTAEELARSVGMSRSAFADRFTRIVGETPMRYLAQQRLQLAARRLEASGDAIARVAFEAGYESEAAFNRAFKREFGTPPATWRANRAPSRG